MSRISWFSLQLAAACLLRDTDAVTQLAAIITHEFDNRDIKKLWRTARICLNKSEISWLMLTLKELAL